MLDNILFYLIFSSQLLLLSVYIPYKIHTRMSTVLNNYPPSKYPKLYTKPLAYYQQQHKTYVRVNQILFLFGFIMMFYIGYLNSISNGTRGDTFPLLFGLFQFIPFALLELSEYKQLKLMRQANKNTKRQAELNPRRFFDFISPIWLGIAILALLSYIFVELFLPGLTFHWDEDATIRIAAICGVHIMFFIMISISLSGKKYNPLQAHKDRLKQINISIKTSVSTSIALSLFYIALILMGEYDWSRYSIIVHSIYFQVLGLITIITTLRNVKLESIDFDVYKSNTIETKI